MHVVGDSSSISLQNWPYLGQMIDIYVECTLLIFHVNICHSF